MYTDLIEENFLLINDTQKTCIENNSIKKNRFTNMQKCNLDCLDISKIEI